MQSTILTSLIQEPLMDALVSFGGNIKALEKNNDHVTVGGMGILFGNQQVPDLVGDWFTPHTYLGAHRGNGVDTMLHHGIPLKPELASYADTLLPPIVKAEADKHGLLVATILDLRNSYQRKIYEMVEADLLSWSSGAPPHGVKRKDNAPRGEITRWLISEFSYTPTPCEPRLTHIMPLKALLASAESINFEGNNFPVIPAEALEVLKDGARAGLTFSHHCEAVLAAVEGFQSRFIDWFEDRSSSRKAGRVFTVANWQRLDALCVSLGLTHNAMRTLLDEHKPVALHSPDAHQRAMEPATLMQQQGLDEAILQARIRFAELVARAYGVRV